MSRTIAKPTAGELAALRRMFSIPQIAATFNVTESEVRSWVENAERLGVQTGPAREWNPHDPENVKNVREALLAHAFKIATMEDPSATLTAKVAQAKLCQDLYMALGDIQHIRPGTTPADRKEILEKIKRATASAGKHLKAV